MSGRIRVMKFGGTSVGTADALHQVAQILRRHTSNGDRAIAVVSAMSGVTTRLLQGTTAAAIGDGDVHRTVVEETLARYDEMLRRLIVDAAEQQRLHLAAEDILADYSTVCNSVFVLREATPRALDRALSCGEPLVVLLLASLLRQLGSDARSVEAADVIVTDRVFQHAVPSVEATERRAREILGPLLSEPARIVPIVAGFIGATEDGETTTLGRGGSDFSAAVLGNALNVDEVWIWTDVDGVMTADPRIAADARIVPDLSYGEVAELAYFGAKVLHPRTIRPLVEKRIPLWIKNTFRPEGAGTCIRHEAVPSDNPDVVKAVTHVAGLSLIKLEGRGMLGVPGVAARTFEAVAHCNANVLMISQASSEQSICFVVSAEDAGRVIRKVSRDFERELARRDIDAVTRIDGVDIVTALAVGMQGAMGIASQVFSALARRRINILAIAQGSSKYSISVAVASRDSKAAVLAVHEEVTRQWT